MGKTGRSRALLALLQFAFSSDLAHATSPNIMRTQWLTANPYEFQISGYVSDQANGFKLQSGMNFDETKIARDPLALGACTDTLKRLTRYPLLKMLETGYISREQFNFYTALGSDLDLRQIVFFNTAVPKEIEYDFSSISALYAEDPFRLRDQRAKVFGDNLLAFGDDAANDAQFEAQLHHQLEIQSSLWLVRNFFLDEKGETHAKSLAWQVEKKFADIPPQHPGGLDFELGRTAKETAESIQPAFNAALVTAMNDVLALGKDPAKSRVFIHALAETNARLYERYGFKIVGATTPAAPYEVMMAGDLATVFDKIKPEQLFHDSKKYGKHASTGAEETLRLRNRFRDAHVHLLDDRNPRTGAVDPLIILYKEDAYAFLTEDLVRHGNDDPGRFFEFFPGVTADLFPNRKMALDFFDYRGQKGNFVFGLSSERLATDPLYLEKTIAGIYSHQIAELNRGLAPGMLSKNLIHETPLVFITKDEALLSEARRIGATVTPIKRQYRTATFGEKKSMHLESTAYSISVDSMTQKRMTARYYSWSGLNDLKRGYYQKHFQLLNPL